MSNRTFRNVMTILGGIALGISIYLIAIGGYLPAVCGAIGAIAILRTVDVVQ